MPDAQSSVASAQSACEVAPPRVTASHAAVSAATMFPPTAVSTQSSAAALVAANAPAQFGVLSPTPVQVGTSVVFERVNAKNAQRSFVML